MGSDNLHIRRSAERKSRKENILKQRSSNWLIVCEGTKTEPNYFEKAIQDINTNIEDKYRLKVKVVGKGVSTKSLVKATDLQIKIDKYSNSVIPYGKIFVVFDKDSFSDDDFDDTIKMCEDNGYIPLWSNQAFEYWFLLHFNYVEGKIHRTQYASKLNEYFKSSGLNYKYKKNDKEIFNKLCKYGSLENAIKRAKKIHTSFGDTHPSEQESATTVYKFFNCVEEKIQEFN